MRKRRRLAIYALHPITYQTPIFVALKELIDKEDHPYEFEVLFGDDLSLRAVYYEHLSQEVTFDNNLFLEKFAHKFLKNYARDSRKGFCQELTLLYFSGYSRGDMMLFSFTDMKPNRMANRCGWEDSISQGYLSWGGGLRG